MSNLLFRLANLAVNLAAKSKIDYTGKWKPIKEIIDFIGSVLPYVLIVVATAGTIYAVVLGVNMAKADDAGKREEAKKRIVNFVIALVVTIVLILLLKLFADNIELFLPDSWTPETKPDEIKPIKPKTLIGLLRLK